MVDAFGREITYLRISVTERCNYRCRYCMEEGGVVPYTHADILSFEEIAEIAESAAALGIRKIRLTGGEPLVRRGVVDLCKMLRSIPDLSELTMTTNGSLLAPLAKPLREAGVDRLNISLDTLDPEKFHSMTRGGSLSDVLNGLDAAEAAGFLGTKLNVVLIGGFNDEEIPTFAALTKERVICVRFIELMPIGCAAGWNSKTFLSSEAVKRALPELEFLERDGVSERYRLPGSLGTIGLISPIHAKFCSRCDRIRLTSDGQLKPCLHSAMEYPLRGLHGDALMEALQQAIWAKPKEHHMDTTHSSDTMRRMFEIGG